MNVFIRMGYVTSRKGAKLHLITPNGLSHCPSGGRRIIRAGTFDQHSSGQICKRCAGALRNQLIWRADDLYRVRRAPGVPQQIDAIHALVLALDPPCIDQNDVEHIEHARYIHEQGEKMRAMFDPVPAPAAALPDSEDQPALF